MFEKLAEASKYVLALTAALYLLGFLCMTAFLSRFGIVDFDILNARFLIAGIFPFIGISLGLATGWNLRRNVLSDRQRARDLGKAIYLKAPLILLVTTLAVSFFLWLMFGAGRYQSGKGFDFIEILSFGEHSFVGKVVALIQFDFSPDLLVIVRLTALSFFYFVIIFVTLILAERIAPRSLLLRLNKALGIEVTIVETSKPDVVRDRPPASWRRTVGELAHFLIVGSFIWALVWALSLYAVEKLRSNFIDFNSFTQTLDLDFSLTFAWFYSVAMTAFVFASFSRVPIAGTTSETFKVLSSPMNIAFAGFLLLLPLLTSVITFGAAIFPRIPFSLGGGEPRSVVIHKVDSSESEPLSVFLLGENAQYFYVVTADGSEPKAMQISKDAIEVVETKKQMNSANANHRR